MRQIATGRILLFGFLVWLIPFGVSFLIFPLRESQRPLFESIMPVVISLTAMVFAILYLRRVTGGYFRAAVRLGVIWSVISLGLDLLMFMWGPMQMPFADYIMDIGLVYLIILTLPMGIGYLVEQKAGDVG